MNQGPLLALLSLAVVLGPVASCQCSGGEQDHRNGNQQVPGDGGQPRETLAEQSFQLQNGLQVELVTGPCSDSAALVVLVKVGIDHDPPGRSGMAHLVARALSASVAAGRAQRRVETGNDYTLYSVVASGDLLLDELSDVAAWMSRVAPTEADLERERAPLLQELAKLQGADAALTAMSYAEESVQPTRGNGKRRGIPSELEAITLTELVAFWQAHLKPGNARIAVAGRFDPKQVRGRIEALFSSLPAGTPPVARETADSTVKGTLVMGDAPTAVAVAVPAPAMSSPLYPSFLLLAARLMNEPAKTRTWEVGYDPLKRPELLFITGPVGHAEQPEPAASRIRDEVAAILERQLAAGDITHAKQRFRLLLEPHLLDPAICADDPRAFAVARLRRPQLAGSPLSAALDTTTKEQLDEARKLFEPKHTAAVIAGGKLPQSPPPKRPRKR